MSDQKKLENIICQYSEERRLLRSSDFSDGGIDPLFPRLERAAMNQLESGSSTLSRYGIWVNTARDNICHGAGTP